jgi:predicted MPP superfamily phosphohydrolase
MLLFLLTYLSIYSGMTVYVFYRLTRGLGGSARVWLPLWLGAAGMMLLPMLLHRLEGRLGLIAARCLAGTAWTWLVLIFWALSLFLVVDLWNLAVALAATFRQGLGACRLSPRLAVLALLGALPLLCAWGWIEGGIIRLHTLEVPTPRLPTGTTLRLAQISDVHLGLTSRRGVWRKVLATLRAAQPDLLVSTGDLVDASDRFVEDWLRELDAIRPHFGKYAVLGNHEVYADVGRSSYLLSAAGFALLRGAAVEPTPGLVLVGLDDPAVGQHGDVARSEASAFPATRPAGFVVLLKHRPVVSETARRQCDLQLSGHTHGGQVFPFGPIVRLLYPHPHGRLVDFSEGLRLYVSRGTGTWGPPFRLLAPAEVTLFLIRGTGGAPRAGSPATG